MAMRNPTIYRFLLTTFILVSLFTIFRYFQEYQRLSLLSRICQSTSNSSVVSSTSRDGAFYPATDVADLNEDWDKKECSLQQLSDLNVFYEYIYTPGVPCEFKMMLGGHLAGNSSKLDGDKWVCMDNKFHISPRKCLIFSFGIGHDWSFEDEAERKLGCEVFAFDPTINKRTHNRTKKIHFFNLGIGDSNNTGPQFKVKTNRYRNILSDLGHLNSVIDILKMDTEGNELRFFRDVLEGTPNLLKNVKFIAMEVHIGKSAEITSNHISFWKYFQLLDCFGFKIVYSAVNPFTGGTVVNGRLRSRCFEIVWVQDRKW